MLEEVECLKALEGVAGLPRVLGYSVKPIAFLMTQHGTITLDDLVKLIDKRGETSSINKILLIDILVRLAKILEDIHVVGFAHNDLKADQAAVTLTNTDVEVILLDLGCMIRFGSRPFARHINRKVKSLERMCMMSCHIAPELIYGGKASSASDVYSFADLVEYCRLYNTTLSGLVTKARNRDPEKRPSLQEFRNALLEARAGSVGSKH